MSDIAGLFLGLALTIFGGGIVVGIGALFLDANETLGSAIMIGVGLLQFIYVIPVFLEAKKKNYGGLKVGLIIGASLVFLFSSACGLLLWSFSGTNFH